MQKPKNLNMYVAQLRPIFLNDSKTLELRKTEKLYPAFGRIPYARLSVIYTRGKL